MDKFYGKYRGEVVDVKDPELCGRIRVKCPSVLGTNVSNWALPCFPPNTFYVPKVGDLVWVEFEEGYRDEPIWVGVFYTTKQWKQKFGRIYNPKDFVFRPEEQFSILAGKGIAIDCKLEGITIHGHEYVSTSTDL